MFSKVLIFARKYWWLFLLGLVFGGLIFRANENKKAKLVEEKSFKVEKTNLEDALEISGEIDAGEKVTLRFQSSGMLAWVGVKEGDVVKKFQVLANLDRRELQNQFNQLMNTYSKQRNDFEQAQSDNKNWETAGMSDVAREEIKRVLQDEQADLNNSVLTLEAKELALKYAILYTPIAGIVTKVDSPLAGQNVTPSTATFEVINPDTIYFSALADQTEVTKFKVGMNGSVTLDAFPDQSITAEVIDIAFVPKSGETGTVYEIKMKMPKTDQAIKMGMSGDAKFVFKEYENILTVPEAFIKTEDGKKYVQRKVGKEIIKTEITIGDTIDGTVQVLSGINENEILYSN